MSAAAMWKLEDGVLTQLLPPPARPRAKRQPYRMTLTGRVAKAEARKRQRAQFYQALVDALRNDLSAYRRLRTELQESSCRAVSR